MPSYFVDFFNCLFGMSLQDYPNKQQLVQTKNWTVDWIF